MDVVVEPRDLPAPFGGRGLLAYGTNESDDLFIYARHLVTGFLPNREYTLHFEVTFVTDAPAGCVGAGGPPGEAVAVKAGASVIEPRTVLDGERWRMNVDIGEQQDGGADALNLGNVATTNTDCMNRVYQQKTLASTTSLDVDTDASGSLWLLLGIDSGYESTSHVYWRSLEVTATAR